MAGLSTAIWVRRLGLSALVLEQAAEAGRQLLREQAEAAGAVLRQSCPAAGIDVGARLCRTAAGQAMVVAKHIALSQGRDCRSGD